MASCFIQRARREGTGMAGFMIMGGIAAMPVRVAAYVFNFVISLCIFEPQRFKYLPKDQHLP
jgi:hypothetical protein